MILADTSVWIDHLRSNHRRLSDLLENGRIVMHPFIVGEIALGRLRQRETILSAMRDLPRVVVATDDEVLHFIERHSLAGEGIGYVDAHLTAAVHLNPGCALWTRDKRLKSVAERLGVFAS